MRTHSIAEGNRLYTEKQYAAALEIYRRIALDQPAFASTLNFNISRCEQQINKEAGREAAEIVERARASAADSIPVAPATKPSLVPAPPISLSTLYEQVEQSPDARAEAFSFSKGSCPLVSVILTAHNTEEYVEESLESLLAQTYPNVEIIVVDDASSDMTPSIVHRVARSNSGIRSFRLNTNLGTYYAKNLGIRQSRGEVIFFQDSDDICHPYRIALQMKKLQGNGKQIVRGAYARVDPTSQRVITVNNYTSKLGLITLGVRREVFNEIGFFNCTTKASDDEFFNRAVRYLGKPAIVDLPLPLYYNTMRENSLFADMVQWTSEGSIEQKPSPARAGYVEVYKAAHAEQSAANVKQTFSFPRVRDALVVFPEMSKLANPSVPVIVNVCSIPEREKTLERTLRSIALQCDQVNVYLDRYEHEPDFLRKLPVSSVRVVRSQSRPGLRDNGKFIALEELSRKGEDAYYFTLDDDIEYPLDYVNALIKVLQNHEDNVVVGVHGVTLRDQPKGYFSDRRMVHSFTKSLERHRLVNVLGTGTTAFRAGKFAGFDLQTFTRAGMADIFLALECRRRGLPMLCVSRFEGWLRELSDPHVGSLFTEFKGDDRPQTELLQSQPLWGFAAIAQTLDQMQAKSPDVAKSLASYLPQLCGVTRISATNT